MTCYHPIKAWKGKELSANGKRKLVFNPREAFVDMPVTISCGYCIGCRLARSRDWAVRAVHEASLHDDNCFVTLTYDNDNLPEDESVSVEDIQKFVKRLRKQISPRRIRFVQAAEYGTSSLRPHYHIIIFGFDPVDKRVYKIERGNRLFNSDSLTRIWGKGHVVIGSVTFDSVAYVARYITKKVFGDRSEDYYKKRKPEFMTMSRRPGIGFEFYQKYKENIYKDDFVVVNKKKFSPPLYYDRLFEKEYPDRYREIVIMREAKMESRLDDYSYDRLLVKELLQMKRFNQLPRKLEEAF